MDSKLRSIVESRFKAEVARQDALVEAWKDYIEAAAEFSLSEGREMTEQDKRNLAQCLENASEYCASSLYGGKTGMFINEATQAQNIEFLGVEMLRAA